MLKLLTVIADKTPENVHMFSPKDGTIGVQLSFKRNIIVTVAFTEDGQYFTVSVMESIPEAKVTKLKAQSKFVNGDVEYVLCETILNEHFSEEQQNQTCDHFALLLNGKNVELAARKGN